MGDGVGGGGKPLNGQYFVNSEYHTSLKSPPFRSDPGAGQWNSKPLTAEVIAKRLAILVALGPATWVYPGPNSTKHMVHYFTNTGADYTIDLENMLTQVPSARVKMWTEYDAALTFIKMLPAGRFPIASRYIQSDGYNQRSENMDWYLAIAGYSRWGTGIVEISDSPTGKQYVLDFTYNFYDRYNWDGDKAVQIGPVLVTDEAMGEFHRQGIAKEFHCFGSVSRHLEWSERFGPPGAEELLRPRKA